jgi:hypothetical protein
LDPKSHYSITAKAKSVGMDFLEDTREIKNFTPINLEKVVMWQWTFTPRRGRESTYQAIAVDLVIRNDSNGKEEFSNPIYTAKLWVENGSGLPDWLISPAAIMLVLFSGAALSLSPAILKSYAELKEPALGGLRRAIWPAVHHGDSLHKFCFYKYIFCSHSVRCFAQHRTYAVCIVWARPRG